LEEKLYPAMENFNLSLLVGHGLGARSIKIELPKFTLIGATERIGLIRERFRRCFGISLNLGPYETEALQLIIERTSHEWGATIDGGAARLIASRAQGSQKVAKILLRRIRDYAEVEFDGCITERVVFEALTKIIAPPR
jgi:Holliday junction DNA helicase RuvB